jgi:hypothetical protein
MPAESAPTFVGKEGQARSEPVTVSVIGSDARCSGEMPRAQRSVLAAADVVLHEGNVDPAILKLVRQGAFVEPVSVSGHPTLTRAFAIARARKLAGEGWRVVWLVAGDADHLAPDFAEAGLVAGDHGAADAVVVSGRAPRLLATALNGLAG